jgi:carbamoyltransferase
MTILGISAFYHDSAAAIIVDGEIVAAAQEERFSRKKHEEGFPVNAVKFCLRQAGIDINKVDAVAFYDKPLLKFERLLETYYAFAPKGVISFLRSMPVWLKDKIFLKRIIHEGLGEIEGYNKKKTKLLFPEHHLSHAASAFYSSPFQEAAILTIDGVGEWSTASISLGRGKDITVLKELHFPDSVGLLYSAFTYFLGFKVNSGEYKLMGLAPYGNAGSAQVAVYIEQIKTKLIDIKDDGSIWLNQEYFDYATGLKMVNNSKWERLFGFPKRQQEEEELSQAHCNLALAIQTVTEEIVLLMAAEAKRLTGADNLCMAGGVALNCVANGRLLQQNIFKELFIQPASGDAGGALGAAQAAYHIFFGKERLIDKQEADKMKGAYLGPYFSDDDAALDLQLLNAVYKRYESYEELAQHTAALLADGNVVGWFQGKMEFGPRALGNRSILADAGNVEMQKKLNLKIKYREGFRPFAPSVLVEDYTRYFDLAKPSPYMLLVAPVKADRISPLPADYGRLALRERLYTLRSDIQAVTHVDFSARVQTVDSKTNYRYWTLIDCFKQKTGYGLLVNTSFNVRGEPPVCTPADAYTCFMRTGMDYLVIGNLFLAKAEQPEWQELGDWKNQFKLD